MTTARTALGRWEPPLLHRQLVPREHPGVSRTPAGTLREMQRGEGTEGAECAAIRREDGHIMPPAGRHDRLFASEKARRADGKDCLSFEGNYQGPLCAILFRTHAGSK